MSKLQQIIESHLPKEKNTAEENLKGLLDEEIRDMMFYQSVWNSCLAKIKKAIPKMEEEIVEMLNKRITKYKNDPTLSDSTKVALIVEYEYLLNTLTK